jgi:hypothetical protein
VGDAGFAARVEHNVELAQHLESCVAAAGDKFLMAVPRVAANVCFWCVGLTVTNSWRMHVYTYVSNSNPPSGWQLRLQMKAVPGKSGSQRST